ncbi:MAG: BON domain-containing protein, partial [Anaerolineae bacterium]|nr:BON domain-containing protein [Anaerolineae bacterium]
MANDNRDDRKSDKLDEPVVAVPLPLNNTGSGFIPAVMPVPVDEANVTDADGVRINRVGVGLDGYEHPDARIDQEITDHLTQHTYIDATEIVVTVKNGEVTLEGSVPDNDQKKYAEEVA